MVQVTDDDDDRTAFESVIIINYIDHTPQLLLLYSPKAISATLADKVLVEKISQRFLSKKKYVIIIIIVL